MVAKYGPDWIRKSKKATKKRNLSRFVEESVRVIMISNSTFAFLHFALLLSAFIRKGGHPFIGYCAVSDMEALAEITASAAAIQ